MKSKKLVTFFLLAAMVLSVEAFGQQQRQGRGRRRAHPPRDVYEGWRLGTQAYTFNRFTFFEAVDKAASLGLSWMEAYPGQKVSNDINAGMGPGLNEEQRAAVKKKLSENGIKLICFGVTGLPNNEAEARKTFEFAKDMGIETITSEPSEDSFDLLDKLAQEYEISVAIHNHPEPSHYWNPDTVLKVCEGRSKYIGACADTGHWARSGLDPLECVKKLKDRIIYFHLKDLNKVGKPHGHDVHWGEGVCKLDQILAFLHEQGWKGYFSSEYEYNWDNNVPDLRASYKWFEKTAAGINPSGWKKLLADDLSNTIGKGNWKLEDDVLSRETKGGDIWAKGIYGNFILDLEFKVDEKTNSGVFIRTADVKDCVQTGIEVQILQPVGKPSRNSCGAIYDCLPIRQETDPTKGPGEWNHITIYCRDNVIAVSMNGQFCLMMNLDEWTEAGMNPSAEQAQRTMPKPDGKKNKFRTAYKDMKREGHIGFQDHGHPVWYRNIKIREI